MACIPSYENIILGSEDLVDVSNVSNVSNVRNVIAEKYFNIDPSAAEFGAVDINTEGFKYGAIVTGQVLSDTGFKFYKLTNKKELHHRKQYGTGPHELNDGETFDPSGECKPGGIYLFAEHQLVCHEKYASSAYWIREVTFPPDAKVYVERNKYKADKLILGERNKFRPESLYKYLSHRISVGIVARLSQWLLYFKFENETPYLEIIRHANKYGTYVSLSTIPKKVWTIALVKLAIGNDPTNIRFVNTNYDSFTAGICIPKDVMLHHQELCELALSKNLIAIKYVPVEYTTWERWVQAFEKFATYLFLMPKEYLGKVTTAMYMDGFNRDPTAFLAKMPLELVTEEMCEYAVRKNPHSLVHIPEKFLTLEFYTKLYSLPVPNRPKAPFNFPIAGQVVEHTSYGKQCAENNNYHLIVELNKQVRAKRVTEMIAHHTAREPVTRRPAAEAQHPAAEALHNTMEAIALHNALIQHPAADDSPVLNVSTLRSFTGDDVMVPRPNPNTSIDADADLVMSQVNFSNETLSNKAPITRETVVAALQMHRGDIVDTITYLTK